MVNPACVASEGRTKEAVMLIGLNITTSAILLALAGMAAAVALAASPAEALPTQCRIFTYYTDVTMTEMVGVRTTCPGGGGWGRTSRFREVETINLNENSGPSTGPGGLPCEFLAAGCSNLPRGRHG